MRWSNIHHTMNLTQFIFYKRLIIMGFRTLVLFDNDHLDRFLSDEKIGEKIKDAIQGFGYRDDADRIGNLGLVVERDHADVAKLVIIGKNGQFGITELSTLYTTGNAPDDGSTELLLLSKAAAALGYKLVKKPQVFNKLKLPKIVSEE